jgi:predicted nucleotidyltransferase
VKVFWLDRERLLSLALAACGGLLKAHESVLRAGVFGSVATGRAVPGSDLDVLLVLSELRGPRHHAAAPFHEHFEHIAIGTEIHCATGEDLRTNPFFTAAAREAIWAEPPV